VEGCRNYFNGTCINLDHYLALELLCIRISLLYLAIYCIVLLLLACHQNLDTQNFIYLFVMLITFDLKVWTECCKHSVYCNAQQAGDKHIYFRVYFFVHIVNPLSWRYYMSRSNQILMIHTVCSSNIQLEGIMAISSRSSLVICQTLQRPLCGVNMMNCFLFGGGGGSHICMEGWLYYLPQPAHTRSSVYGVRDILMSSLYFQWSTLWEMKTVCCVHRLERRYSLYQPLIMVMETVSETWDTNATLTV
jgi:hypothetical protein